MQSTDITGNLRAIFFGFKIGDVTISIESIAVALISFLMVLAGTRAVQGWLEDRYLPQTRLDSGLRNSIKTSLGYVGFMLALTLAAANLGVDFQKLAIVAGALSVGIGFGLQSIVNNFVSGLILLWERAVRVGDWVVVGSDQGYVRKINVRSTEIETFDRASVIVPNSNLVSGVVKNLMRTDRVGRMTIEVTVNAAADPEKVREVLIDIARDNESVVSLPSPQVRFVNLTAGAMTFDLFCFVADVENMLRTKSDLYFEICRQFREHRFFDGPPADPLGINLVGLERLEAILQAQRAPDAAPPVLARKTG
jgi:small-conductance mechanosensitive channel